MSTPIKTRYVLFRRYVGPLPIKMRRWIRTTEEFKTREEAECCRDSKGLTPWEYEVRLIEECVTFLGDPSAQYRIIRKVKDNPKGTWVSLIHHFPTVEQAKDWLAIRRNLNDAYDYAIQVEDVAEPDPPKRQPTCPLLLKQLRYNRGPVCFSDEAFEQESQRRAWVAAKKCLQEQTKGKKENCIRYRGIDIRLFTRDEMVQIASLMVDSAARRQGW